MTIDQTLADRGKTYGPFLDKAKTVQALIDVVIHEPGWERLAADQKQCIMVCFDKFARAIHGDPNHRDNFHDVVGYAKLVDDRMAADEAEQINFDLGAIDSALRAPRMDGDILDLLDDGWKLWDGGKRPGTAETKFDLRFRAGNELYGCHTNEASWEEWNGADIDIVAYRESVPAEAEWIPVAGGGVPCPVAPDQRVDVRYGSGEERKGIRADSVHKMAWEWNARLTKWCHVQAYRLTPAPRT